MSRFEQITRGRIVKPLFVGIYGSPGVGKNTWAAAAPRPIFVGPEEGTYNMDVARYPIARHYKEVLSDLEELLKKNHDFKTVVLDSMDLIETLLFEQMCLDYSKKSVEAFGYNSGYKIALVYWKQLKVLLDQLREKGMNIILIAHSQIRKLKDPVNQAEYDHFELALHKDAAAYWRFHMDALLFANFEVFTHKENGKTRAISEGLRFLYTEFRHGYDAKNRFALPLQMPLDWGTFVEAVRESQGLSHLQLLRNEISQLCERLEGSEAPKVRASVEQTVKEAGDNTGRLEAVRNRLKILTGENEPVEAKEEEKVS